MKIKIYFTLIFLLCLNSKVFSQSIITEKNDGFFRVKIYTDKNLVNLSKLGNTVTLKTLNSDEFDKIKKDLDKIKKLNYVQSVEEINPVEGNNVFSLKVKLKKGVDLFSFYKARDKAYYIDLWDDNKTVKQKASSIKVVKKTPVKKAKKVAKPVVVKKPKVIRIQPKKKVVKASKKLNPFRDFRYGASFVWNYPAQAPVVKEVIKLERKTPEFFYPVKDREYEKNEKEAHIQLSINLYRKKKWGLMYKSIKLYTDKYGEDDNFTFNEYLKANALLRESRDRDDIKPIQTAVTMFINIAETSKNYELRKGIYKYLIQYFRESKDYISTLKYGKRFFADAKENFDYEELEYASEIIFLSLSKLNQIEKIQNLVKEKTIQKIMPKQKMLAYEVYSLLLQNKEEEVVKAVSKFRKKNKGKLLSSTVYNLAEANFRLANYKEAIKYYDEFLSNYSYFTNSAKARLRIALSYDLLNRKAKEVQALYMDAINKSKLGETSLEARIRYVGFRTIRKRNVTKKDREYRVFLDKGNVETPNKELERLLWQTRLRSLIVDEKYEEALTFLTALPLSSMKLAYKKTFEGDGAEIIYGIIKKNYQKGNYARAIRAWEIYKNVYFSKVASDPEIQFVVAKSYMNLGLWTGFQRVFSKMESKKTEKTRSFPIWISRLNIKSGDIVTTELQILRNIKLKNWASVNKLINKLAKIDPNTPKLTYYRALVNFRLKKYKQSEAQFESFFSKTNNFTKIDGTDLLESVQSYMESIYEQGKSDKFLNVSEALLQDTARIDVVKEAYDKVRERINYLRVEVLVNKRKPEGILETREFVKEFKKSVYLGRVKFLLGKEEIRLKNIKVGKKILDELISAKDVADYIKEMAKAELTLLNLRNRSL